MALTAQQLADVTAVIEPEAKALGFDLVRVTFFGGDEEPTLQIMAERPATRQLTIDDCAALSRRISERFDALEAEGRDPLDSAYRLEVSSPGIDRPLTRPSDFADWAGHDVRVTLAEKRDGRLRFNGVLDGIDTVTGLVAITDKDGATHRVPFDAIDSAKLVLTDRLIAATVPLSADGADEHITDDTSDDPSDLVEQD